MDSVKKTKFCFIFCGFIRKKCPSSGKKRIPDRRCPPPQKMQTFLHPAPDDFPIKKRVLPHSLSFLRSARAGRKRIDGLRLDDRPLRMLRPNPLSGFLPFLPVSEQKKECTPAAGHQIDGAVLPERLLDLSQRRNGREQAFLEIIEQRLRQKLPVPHLQCTERISRAGRALSLFCIKKTVCPSDRLARAL